MKVLFIANSVFIPEDQRKTVTGYDYIVSEIAHKLSERCEIDLYLVRPYPRSLKAGKVSIIGHSYKDLLKYVRLSDVATYIKIAAKGKTDFKSRLRNVTYYWVMRDIERLIKRNNYDIVHVHGVEFMDVVASLAAARCQVPFLYTMHGLISYGIPNISQLDMDSEQAALNIVRDNDFVITTVSTGTKMVPCEDKGINPDKVVVVNNAVKTVDTAAADWKEKYPQIEGKRLIISIGSVSYGKNQIQLLRAFSLLPDEVKAKTMIFLAGQDLTGGVVGDYVKEHQLEDKVVICGFLSKQELAGLYQVADYNALLSISEGFGLSMIEAAKYGIPTLTFADLDAVKDIYSPDSMLVLDDRTDEAVAEGLMKMFSTKWDKEAIIRSVDRFSEDIYFQYIDVYHQIINNKTNKIKPKAILDALGL